MSTALTVLLAVAAWVLASARPAGRDARTCTQMRAAVRHAGPARVAARVLQISVVLTLLLLATVCRLCWHTAHAIGTGAVLVAVGISALGNGPELIGGAAQ